MDKLTITGRFKGVYPVEQVTDKLEKCQFAIDVPDDYNPTIVFTAVRVGKKDNITGKMLN